MGTLAGTFSFLGILDLSSIPETYPQTGGKAMPRLASKLTDTAIRNAKPKSKPYRLADGDGLYLLVKPTGVKLWHFRYRFAGKENMLSLGGYPEITLTAARKKTEQANQQLADNLNPVEQKRIEQAELQKAAANSFAAVSADWYAHKLTGWRPGTSRKVREILDTYLIPKIGDRAIKDLASSEVVKLLREISDTTPATAIKARQFCSQIVEHAIQNGLRPEGYFLSLRGAVKAAPVKHMPAAKTPQEAAHLLRSIDGYGSFPVRVALRLLMLTFVRPGVMAAARWQDIDLDAAEWRIPESEGNKTKSLHIVPLSTQAVELFKEMQPISGGGVYVFPGRDAPLATHLNMNSLSKALRALGFKGQAVPHGSRGMASTLLHGMGFNSEWIERQLAHVETNRVKAAYNHAQYLEERKRMMQHWADYLDSLMAGGKVLPFKTGKA
jgi:integrase